MLPTFRLATLTLALGLTLPNLAGAQPSPAGDSAPGLEPRIVFQVLLGEMALQRGDARLSLDLWSDLAQRTDDPKVLARATEIATFTGQNERALDLVERWLAVEPDSSKAAQTQAALLIQTNRLHDLAPKLAKMLADDPENLANNLLHLNRMLARVNDKARVLELTEALTAPYLNQPEAHFALAQAALAAGEPARALAETDRARQLRPDWEMAAIAHAQLLARTAPDQAIGELERYLRRHPASRETRIALARLLVAEKRHHDARLQYQHLLAETPDDPAVLFPAAMLAVQEGDLSTGQRLLENLLNTPFPDRDSLHFLLGQLAQDMKQPEQALSHFRQVNSGERYIVARARSAQILLQLGRPDEARQLLHDTRGSTPAERSQLTLAEAQLLRDAGRVDEAYALLSDQLRKQPDDIDLIYDTALTAERIGRHDEMEKHLRHLLALQPDHAHALNALGYSWADRNLHLEEAEALIRKALELTPDDPYITDSLGWVLYRQGHLEEALRTLERAYRIKADPEIAAHLGEVLWQSGRRDDAKRLWQDVQRLHPGNSTLDATLKKFLP